MSIEYATGSIFDSDAEVWVNPVNIDGVGGKGLALAFRKKFPKCYDSYVRACNHKLLAPGTVFLCYANNSVGGPGSVIAYFPTKQHWRDPSKLEYISSGMQALAAQLRVCGVTSVAIPALGCGLGGLAWPEVQPVIESICAAQMPNIRVVAYVPFASQP